ncbi:hypothetical protein MSG28_008342 [Choristoneura fumiferana]|uniref:Uncharacterized protein n=1 Tax=Choristoneura fumiferana TaxID=7141 RepID=A0ACC0JB01_CHOFU|nr:hypothetical protein MSG28_008342 [Choristoneura fumiferana]
MEQFYRLLGVCRIPQLEKDRLEFPPMRPEGEQEELVVVACRNYSRNIAATCCGNIASTLRNIASTVAASQFAQHRIATCIVAQHRSNSRATSQQLLRQHRICRASHQLLRNIASTVAQHRSNSRAASQQLLRQHRINCCAASQQLLRNIASTVAATSHQLLRSITSTVAQHRINCCAASQQLLRNIAATVAAT